MKKIFVAVLAMAGVVACNTAEVVDLPQNPAIRFENAFVQNATRADKALDPSTTTESLTAFDVWGFMDEPSGVVFEGEDVTGSKGNFTYVNTQYWAPGHTYYFAALAPMNSANWSLNTATADTTGAGVVTFTNDSGTEDLLYSAVSVAAPASITAAPEAVKFTFSHLLSKVKFTFVNGFTNDNATIDVKNIHITNAPAKASANLVGEWWTANPWTLDGTETVDLAFGDACEKLAMGAKQECANERLTIPAAQDIVVTFDVALYMGTVKAYSGSLEVTVKDIALELGKAYNFTATLTAQNITEDGQELYPIVFDVEEVKDWVVAGTPDAQVKDAELRAAAQFGGEVVLTEDIALSTTLDVTKNLIIDLNGHNLTINNDSDELGEGDGIIVTEGTLTIKGEGTVTANTRAIWARGNGGAVINIEGGHYVGATKGNTCEVIYASGNGVINIYGGTFEAETEDNVSFAAPQYAVLNLHGNGATGCNITVYGGSFKNFNPADNISENPKKNFCADGYSSVADGEWFVVVGGEYDNLARVATIDELQAALDAATGNALIVVGADLVGDATAAQKENVNLTIDGAGYKFDGTLNIHGHNRNNGAETLTIKNVKFYTENAAAKDFIWSADSNNGTVRYAHNITIEDCSFEAPAGVDVVGMRFKQAYNLAVKNCVMNGGHSLVQNTSMTGQLFEGCTVEAGRGINLQTSSLNTKVVNCNIKATKADGYGIRVDAGATSALSVTGSTIEAYEPIVLRSAKASYELNLLNNTLTAAGGYEIVVNGEEPVINGAAGLNIKK